MTRVNTEQIRHTPWYAKAGAASSIVPISRFVSSTIFALKTGGYGCLFSLTGMDEESLTDQELESRVRTIEGALRGLPEGSCLYQYSRVLSGFDIPRQAKYQDPVTESFVNDRLTFLDKTAGFRRIDLHWCLAVEPQQTNPFQKRPTDQAGDNARMLSMLQKTATILEAHLSSTVGLRLLNKNEGFPFLSYLFNLEPWCERDQLRTDSGVDRQIVHSAVSWHSDHLRVGKRYVQMFSLMNTPDISRPCQFSGLSTLDCDSVLCTSWRLKSAAKARAEISQQEKFISFFKVGVLSRVMSGKDTALLDEGAGARAADASVDDLSEVIRSLDKTAQGEFTMRLLLAARSIEQLHDVVPAVHRIFVDARAQVMEETLGNLSSFYTMFPGNQKFNVFPLWLGENHHARLSSVFAPHIGHQHSEDLDAEYLNVFETRTRTPFFQDAYVNGVRVMLIIGPTGTGKTTTLEAIREGAEQGGYQVEGFAPTSKAAGQLREAGIDATTLQSFLARGENHPNADPATRHLYMLDESSLASTKQMRAFLDKLNPDDRVLVIGDTRQHQGVEAGRPFQQMQEAGMQTSQLDKIMRQKDPELLKAVQHLANNETEKGVAMLAEQGRITEIKSGNDRIAAIAKDYADRPDGTIIVSPDNRSRQSINDAVRAEMLDRGQLGSDGREFQTLTHRSDMTGAERTWAARYETGNVLQYTTGSKEQGIDRNSFAIVRDVDARANTLTVETDDGSSITYDPRRLRGVNVFRETTKEFATGERVQFTAANKELSIANRDLGTVHGIEDGRMTVKMDGKDARTISFDTAEFRQFDHGYAITSHSSQGLTTTRVLANINTDSSRSLINTRLAYVSISRASYDAQIYTNNAETLGERLATDVTKTAAVDFTTSAQHSTGETDQTKEALRAFRANDPQKATEILQDQGRVHEYASPDHRLAAVAMDYAARPERTVIIAPDPADRQELTQLIRADLQTQGAIDADSRSFPILVKQELDNPRLASSYRPDDEIHYRKGSPEEHGVADGSKARVVEVDAAKNLLTIENREGDLLTYNPALLKQQTAQSIVFRAEERDLAVGDRVQFTHGDKESGIRSGSLATVERIGDDNSLTARLDSGRAVKLDSDGARHIDHGYTVDSAKYLVADRVILTGESAQLASQQQALTTISPHTKDFAIYTSNGSNPLQRDVDVHDVALTIESPSQNAHAQMLETPAPEVEIRGFGLSL